MFQFCLIILSIILLKLPTTITFRVEHMVQSVAVRGKFICGTRSAIGVRVKLFEHDLNIANAYSQPIQNDEYMLAINHDDVLNETYTDQDGNFFVHGTTVEVNQIQPILKVYHNCLLNGMPGFRKIHFIVPYHFTNYGIHAKRVLDLGIFNLEVILPDEQHENNVL